MAIPTYTKEQQKKLLKKARAAGFRSLSEVSQFQSAYGIKNDGDVGPETRDALRNAKEKHGNKSISELITLGIKNKGNTTSNSTPTRKKDPVVESYRQTLASDNTSNPQLSIVDRTKGESVREKQKDEKSEPVRKAKVRIEATKARGRQTPESISLESNMPELFGNPIARDWNSYIMPLNTEAKQAADDARYIQMIRSMPGFDPNLSDEDILNQRNTIIEQRNSPTANFILSNTPFNPEWHEVHNNLYPYSYSLDGGDISWWNGARQDIEMERKFRAAQKGMDPKRAAMNEFVTLDLNNPQEYQRARDLAKNFTNLDTRNLFELQTKFKVRLDKMNMYDGLYPEYGMFMENPDYTSNTARAARVPTFVYADENMRKADQEAMAAYLATNPTPDKVKDNMEFYSVVGDPYAGNNNYSIVVEKNPDGTVKQARYIDEWDYRHDNIIGKHNRIITGDTIPTNYRQFAGKSTVVKHSK